MSARSLAGTSPSEQVRQPKRNFSRSLSVLRAVCSFSPFLFPPPSPRVIVLVVVVLAVVSSARRIVDGPPRRQRKRALARVSISRTHVRGLRIRSPRLPLSHPGLRDCEMKFLSRVYVYVSVAVEKLNNEIFSITSGYEAVIERLSAQTAVSSFAQGKI